MSADLDAKRFELLKEVVPGLERVGAYPEFPQAEMRWRDAEAGAKLLKLRTQPWKVRSLSDIEAVFSSIQTSRLNGMLVLSDNHQLPAVYPWRAYVEDRRLMMMTYAANLLEMQRRSATFVDKILKGAKPAELPVEQPTKFELVINLKAAKQIGLTIPPNVLARADQVIR